MKKMNYQTPEMEVVELDYQKPLLDGSGSSGDEIPVYDD